MMKNCKVKQIDLQTSGEDVRERSLFQQSWSQFKHNRTAMIGLAILILLMLVVITTIVLDIAYDNQIYKNYVIKQDLSNKLAPPSAAHIFGCDEFGRDLLFRILWGTKYSLLIGISAVLCSLIIGGPLGAIAGFYGGKIDNIIMRIMDVFLACPFILLAMAIVTALGTSIPNLLIALGISGLANYARVTRAAVMSVKDKEFIEAARAVGANDFTIITKYILPNAMAPILVQSSLGTGSSILSVAGLSYIGLGVQPPTPEWGSILTAAKVYMRDAWHVSVIPGIFLVITVVAFNLFGDGLRDALDPKLKH